ncbi:MAG: DUF2017 family protein [Acidimicrobiales bacterium]|nr:DUF2017 family protein [Acidimicrobiales bacterium]
MPSIFRRRFTWVDDRVVVNLPDDEQQMLAHVLPQLRELVMAETDPALRRLRPAARPDDDEAEAAYREMIDNDLLRSRLEAIEIVEEGIGGTTLDDEGVSAWMHSLNALRLVLGGRLDVDVIGNEALENLPDDDDRVGIVALYEWLGWLLEQLVAAAMGALPEGDD